MGLISVIIPVYKSQKYIGKCLDSIIGQTYKDLEIILVDDGSPDQSGEICDEYAKIDERIVVIHTLNFGAWHARNIGLKYAKGEYIAFIDSDDFVDDMYLEHLYKKMDVDKADIVCGGNKEIFKDGRIIYNQYHNMNAVTEVYDHYYSFLSQKDFYTLMIWGKLIRREIIADIKFKSYKFSEDTLFMLELLKKSPKVVFIKEAEYNYVRQDNSVTMIAQYISPEYRESILDVSYEVYKIIADSDIKNLQKLKNEAQKNYIMDVYNSIWYLINIGKDRANYCKCRYAIKKHIKQAVHMEAIKPRQKFLFLIYNININLVWYLITFIGKMKK